MISGFLFYSKLLEGRKKPINWTKLYISRVLRLGPLYFFAVALVFLIIAIMVNEPPMTLLKESLHWISFTALGSPNINGIDGTNIVIAGVTWSLRYEWVFYFSLPLLALALQVSVPIPYLLLSSAVVAIAVLHMHLARIHFVSFAAGIAAVYLVRSDYLRGRASSATASTVVLACLVVVVISSRTAYGIIPLLLLSVVFALIACGNNIFGLLTIPVSRLLGELTYGMYLLQGMVLFVVFKFLIGFKAAAALTPLQYWLVILGCTPLLILISFITFKTIEAPAMSFVHPLSAWLHSRWPWYSIAKVDTGAFTNLETPMIPIQSDTGEPQSSPET